MTLAGKKASEMALPLFLGKDAGGAPLVTDLTQMPHLLLAGTTGSGKSVSLSAIILSLLMTKRPDHVKMILIDPKMVEMSQFKDMPHLMCPIVTDLGRAEKILGWAVGKMDERYELLAEARVKNIAAYNRLGADGLYARLEPATEQEKNRIPVHLPYIVIVIDELADLMMTAAKEVEHHLSRLAQKSRAVGLHIIVATQRPEAKVVTGLIKSNLPSRICFRVASRMDSRIVLDQNGGEVLLGQGDMLFLPPGSHKLLRAQGTYLGEAEIQAVLKDLASRAKPEFHPELVRLRAAGAGRSNLLRDPLFDQAVRILLQSKRGSVSLLQRRLTIGYSRASRLIDQMAEAGIVGDYKGSQAREVLMTQDQWEAIQARIAADREEGYEADQDDEPAEAPWDEDTLETAKTGG
jgi:S-DNA-T family DNA segregation ATPase FtsK/SpoIIIE